MKKKKLRKGKDFEVFGDFKAMLRNLIGTLSASTFASDVHKLQALLLYILVLFSCYCVFLSISLCFTLYSLEI